jgi:transposase-like protein
MVALEDALSTAVEAARDEGASVAEIASALGVHRATVYRRYLSPAAGDVKADTLRSPAVFAVSVVIGCEN